MNKLGLFMIGFIAALAGVAASAGVVAVLIHFIAKYW